MITLTPDQLAEILGLHVRWLRGEPDGKRADLRLADLSSADLRSANLSSADLRSANLSSADLRSADLRSANLRLANLRSANLRLADLSSANLRSADLRSANLRLANLRSANLRLANLSSADLRSANLGLANLGGDIRIVQVGPLGSRADYLIRWWGHDEQGAAVDVVRAGCFSGTLEEFRLAVEQHHGANIYGQQYRSAIAWLETLAGIGAPA